MPSWKQGVVDISIRAMRGERNESITYRTQQAYGAETANTGTVSSIDGVNLSVKAIGGSIIPAIATGKPLRVGDPCTVIGGRAF